MLISIEGIDGAGKTSLAKKMSDLLEFDLLDLNTQMVEPDIICSFDRDSWRVAAVALESLHFAHADAILDRTTLSCWAYQQRGDLNLHYLEQVIEEVKPIIVMLDTPVDVCCERDPDAATRWSWEELNWQRHRMLASGEAFRHRGVPYMRVKPGSNSAEEIALAVCDCIAKQGWY